MTVKEITDKIIEKAGVERLEAGSTCDILVTGSYDQEVTGVITTFMATVDVIKAAVEKGANLIITHEPTWFTGPDRTDWLQDDPVYKEKKELIDKHQIAIWRYHDHMHMEAEDGIYRGVMKEFGWEDYLIEGTKDCFVIPETTLGDLARFFQRTMDMDVVQLVGNEEMKIQRVGVLVGGGSLGLGSEEMPMQMIQEHRLDTVICGDIFEWTLSSYVRDAQMLGLNISMLVLGHERSEEPGMKHLPEWMEPLLSGCPVEFVDAGEPFTYVTDKTDQQHHASLPAEEILKLHVQCSEAKEVGQCTDGTLRVIPIEGGTFEGKLSGVVVAGGADWNTDRGDAGAHVFAKYMLQTEDGEFIAVENEGIMSPGQTTMIKTTPRFQTDLNGPYAWLNYGVYAGSLSAGTQEGEVEITIYRLD